MGVEKAFENLTGRLDAVWQLSPLCVDGELHASLDALRATNDALPDLSRHGQAVRDVSLCVSLLCWCCVGICRCVGVFIQFALDVVLYCVLGCVVSVICVLSNRVATEVECVCSYSL